MAGDQAIYKQMMSQGHSAAWDQEWQRAADFYKQALDEFPESMQAMVNYASACYSLSDYETALTYYTRVLKQTPGDILVLEKVAQIFEHLGRNKSGAEASLRAAELHYKNSDLRKALENWSRTVRLEPGNMRARSRLAMVFERQNRFPQAVSQYIIIASLLQHQGEKERAIEIVSHALKLLPKNLEANQALKLLNANQLLPLPEARPLRHEQPGSRDGQAARLEAPRPGGSDDDPILAGERKALADLASMLFEQDDESEQGGGRDLQSITMGTGPLNQVQLEQNQINMHIGQAIDLQARGHNAQAAEEVERAIGIGLDQSSAQYVLAVLYHREGKFDSALRTLQTAVKHPDYALPARLLMARMLVRTERLKESAIQYLEALRLADAMVVPAPQAADLLQVYEPLVEAYSHKEDAELHRKLITGIDSLLVQKNWLEKVRAMRGQLPAPQEGVPPLPLVELITELEGSLVVDMLTHVHDMARKGYYRIAMEEAFNAIQYAPTYLPLHTFMGEILMKQDRVPEAIRKFSTVARAYSSRGEAARAIDLFRRITRLAPLDLSARQRLIEQLTASGKTEETIQEYLELGDVYYRLADLDQARETYQRALNLSQQARIKDEWTIEILHHLADIDLQRLDWQRAVKIFEQIARIDPGDKKAAMDLIDLHFRLANQTAALTALGNHVAYLNRGGRQPETLETLESLVEEHPDQVPIRRTLAEQYQQAGNQARAIEVWNEIGNRLIEEQDMPGARQAIEAILNLDPPDAGEYRRMLEQLKE